MLIAGFPAGSFQANCYLLAAEPGGECLVVDPGEDALDRLDALLAEHSLTPSAVLLTHGHLDHIATAAELCRRADIPAYLHPADEHLLTDPLAGLSEEIRQFLTGFDLTGLRPPQVLEVAEQITAGGLSLAVDGTPGHTKGSVVYRIEAAGDRPEVLLTGDTLFAGSVGRTDLPGGSFAELESSLREKLLTRPDSAVILPGHGRSSTIGDERRTNPYLAG